MDLLESRACYVNFNFSIFSTLYHNLPFGWNVCSLSWILQNTFPPPKNAIYSPMYRYMIFFSPLLRFFGLMRLILLILRYLLRRGKGGGGRWLVSSISWQNKTFIVFLITTWFRAQCEMWIVQWSKEYAYAITYTLSSACFHENQSHSKTTGKSDLLNIWELYS